MNSSHSAARYELPEDPDSKDKDPLLVPEYIKDIHIYLRQLEVSQSVHADFLKGHKSTPRMRSVLVDWMIEVHSSFKLLLETLHLSVCLLDRYLQADKSVGRDNLQLVGATAMVLAAKYEEMYSPELDDFVFVGDNSYSKRDLLKTEKKMLVKLDYSLGRPQSIHFLRRFNKLACVQVEHHILGKYLIELALLNHELCYIEPSKQAAAAACLSIAILNGLSNPEKGWSKTLECYGGYKYSDFKLVLYKLAQCLLNAESSSYQAVRKKYSSSTFGKMSVNPKLSGTLVKTLAAKAALNLEKKSWLNK